MGLASVEIPKTSAEPCTEQQAYHRGTANSVAAIDESNVDAQAGKRKVPNLMARANNASTIVKPSAEPCTETDESDVFGGQHGEFLEIIFDARGEEKKVQIFKRPLGAEFSKKSLLPMAGTGCVRVTNVKQNSYAAELGIELGWVVASVGGQDVSHKTFSETQATIKSGLMALPDATRQ